MNIFITSSRDS